MRWLIMHNNYTGREKGGITSSNRELLDILNREMSQPFRASEAAAALKINISRARRLVNYWAARGWLTRLKRGLYNTVPLGTTTPHNRKEDPWILASALFSPCYVGGWSACEHWELTDQIFRDIVVFSTKRVRNARNTVQDNVFLIKAISDWRFFGTEVVWKQHTKVLVSDPSHTVVDVLDDPALGAGIKHTAEVIRQYFEGDHRNDEKLCEYMALVKNKTVYKRLGYLIEELNIDAPELANHCKLNLSKGYSVLEPSGPSEGKLLRKWNLKVNVNL